MPKAIEAKYLMGLTITVLAEKKIKGADGEEIRRVPVERELTPEDVLDWKDKGDAVTIVAADGTKHIVSKRGGEEKDPDDKKGKEPDGKKGK